MGQWASGPETAVWTWPSRSLSKGDLRALHAGTDLRIQNVQVQIYPLKFSGGLMYYVLMTSVLRAVL